MGELQMKLNFRASRGFTLVEVLLSMTILSVGVLALGGLLTRSARSAEATSLLTYQAGRIATEAARNDALPFTSLVAGTTCSNSTEFPLPHSLCVTIADVTTKRKTVKVKFTPTSNVLVSPDSVMFERSISGNPSNPLSTP